MNESSEHLEGNDPLEPYLKLGLIPQWTGNVERAFQFSPGTTNPQDGALSLYALQQWLDTHGNTIPVDKKPLIELKNTILQTGFDVSSSGPSDRIRAFGALNPTQTYSIKYDIFIDYQPGDKTTDGQARLRFPFPGIRNTEFLQDIKVNASGEVLGISGINYVLKKDSNTFQFGTGVSTEKKIILTSRIKTMHGKFGTKHILNYTINDQSLSARNEATYMLINNCSLLISVKSKISPDQIEINPVIGIEYTF